MSFCDAISDEPDHPCTPDIEAESLSRIPVVKYLFQMDSVASQDAAWILQGFKRHIILLLLSIFSTKRIGANGSCCAQENKDR